MSQAPQVTVASEPSSGLRNSILDALGESISGVETEVNALETEVDTLGNSLTGVQSQVELYHTYGAVDIRDFDVTANDPDFNNLPALELAMLQAYADRRGVFIPAGDWHLGDQPLDHATLGDALDQFYLFGVCSEAVAQLQENPAAINDNTFSRLITYLAEGGTWAVINRPYLFGPIRMKNFTFNAVNRIKLFEIGDITLTSPDAISMRGLIVQGCYFPCTDSCDNGWMVDEGASGVTVSSNNSMAFDTMALYDSMFRDCAFRGWGKAAMNHRHPDRLLLDNCRSFLGPLLNTKLNSGNEYVASSIINCYSEVCLPYGLNVKSGMIANLRCEAGYPSGITPDLKPYALPVGVTWSVTAANDYVALANFPSGKTAVDYFTEDMIVELRPVEATEATTIPRLLYITAVTADRITFKRATSTSYIGRSISGIGTGIIRIPAILILDGNGIGVSNFSIGNNDTADIKKFAYIPAPQPIEMSINAESFQLNTNNAGIIVSSSAGVQSSWGALSLSTKAAIVDHPQCYTEPNPKPNANWVNPIYYEDSRTQIFKPARGVGAWGDNGRDLTYHSIADSTLGENVWCYRLSDSIWGWKLRPLRRAGVALTYDIRYYVSSGTPSLSIGCEGAASAPSIISLSTGWNNAAGSIAANQLTTDSHGSFLRLYTVANVYIAEVKIVQAG